MVVVAEQHERRRWFDSKYSVHGYVQVWLSKDFFENLVLLLSVVTESLGVGSDPASDVVSLVPDLMISSFSMVHLCSDVSSTLPEVAKPSIQGKIISFVSIILRDMKIYYYHEYLYFLNASLALTLTLMAFAEKLNL
ncbi:uncharacterized protein G2W53_023266 [Senna tora]|uniref:Uncharacterized protein n=1 Tax=Senna tora TaxID=362788 RepID=A0A834TA30_9FABA|nr:uncharacterized protein G2W53_023266 [Senna tora]